MPDTKPPLFQVKTGLNPNLLEKKVVFEKYVQTRIGTAVATKLYDSGDYYKIYLSPNKNLYKDKVSWKKSGVLSQEDLKEIREISNNSVVDFINEGPHKKVSGAIENINWYFYFDQPKFVQSQLFQWQFWKTPKFVGKMNSIIQ